MKNNWFTILCKAALGLPGKSCKGFIAFVRRRFSRRAAVIIIQLAWMTFKSNLVIALPQGAQVVAGKADIAVSNANTMVVTTSDKVIINYQDFSIGQLEKVHFVQPKTSSCALNRVTGIQASSILGTLSANGKVFLVNPNGVYFGPSASVSTGGLIASTLNIADDDFLNERFRFFLENGYESSSIVNQGALNASPEGQIVLMAPHIQNEGIINAKAGKVVMASGEKVALDFAGDGLVRFAVDGELADGSIEQSGIVQAPGGEVYINVKTANKIIRDIVNTDGLVEGNKIVKKNGVVRIASRSRIDAEHVAITSQNVEMSGQTKAMGSISIKAQDTVKIRDSQETPFVAHAHKNFTIEGDKIDILALSHPETSIASGGSMTLMSDNPISADAHLHSGDFVLCKTDGTPGDFFSLYDPIISATGSVTFGAYSGVALKVESTASITATGSINITGPDTTVSSSDSDYTTLSTSAALILRADTTIEGFGSPVPPTQTAGGASFTSSGSGTGINFPNGSTITTAAGGPVILDGAVTLGNDTSISTSGGNVNFTSTVDGGFNLSIAAGSGTVTMVGAVGGSTPLNDYSVTSASTLSTNTIDAAAINVSGITTSATLGALTAAAGGITLNGAAFNLNGNITTTASGGFSLTNSGTATFATGTTDSIANTFTQTGNGAVNINATSITTTAGDIDFDNGGTLTISSSTTLNAYGAFDQDGAGNVSTGATIETQNGGVTFTNGGTLSLTSGSTITPATFFTQNGAGTVNAQGSITTTDGDIDFSSAVTLTGLLTLDSSSNNHSIDFSSTVDNGFNLTMTAAGGDITFGSTVGGTSRLGYITINTADNVNFTNNVTADSILQSEGAGTTTFAGTVNTSTPINSGISLTGTNFIFEKPVTVTGGGDVLITNSETLTIDSGANFSVADAFIQNGGGSSSVSLGANITTTAGNISFGSPVNLTNSIALSMGSSSGAINFENTLDGTFNLGLTAGTGSINFVGVVGGTSQLNNVTIVSANNVTASQNFTSGSIVQSAGAGSTIFDGTVSTNGLNGINLTNNIITFNNVVNAINAGMTITDATSFTTSTTPIQANLSLQGPFIQNGASSPNSIGGNITTSGGQISFAGPVTMTGANLTISNSGGPGNVTFNSTLNFVETSQLTINAGSGNLLFNGAVGQTTPPDVLDIVSANNVTANGAIKAGTLSVTGITGTTTFQTLQQSTNAQTLTLSGNIFNLNGPVTYGTIAITNSGQLTIASGSTINAPTGSFTQSGGGSVSLGANITAVGISFANAVTLVPSLSIALNSTGAISFGSTIDGASNLSLNAGGNALTFTGDIGDTTPLLALSIFNASSLSAQNISAQSIIQGDVSGNSSFGNLTTSGSAGMSLSGSTFTFNGPVTTTGGGPFILNNSGAVTLTSPFSLSGDFAQVGSGPVSLDENISTTNHNITFAGKVTLSTPVTLNAGTGAGIITLSGTVNGSEPLTLTTGTAGTVNLSASIGGTTPLASLTATGGTIVQSSALNSTGNVTFNATTIKEGGNITLYSSSANINLNGNVLANSATTSTLTTGTSGNITITGTLNGGGGGNSISLKAGNIFSITGDIGTTSALTTLLVQGSTVNIQNVGTSGSQGVTSGFSALSTNVLNFNKATYNANGQSYASKSYNLLGGSPTTFKSGASAITFASGPLNLNGKNLVLDTSNGAITLPSILSSSANSTITISAGTGTLRIGPIDPVTSITSTSGPVFIVGHMTAGTIDFVAHGSILNATSPTPLTTTTGNITLNAIGGDIGVMSPSKPIQVAPKGDVMVGAKTYAVLKGTGTITIKSIASNPPCIIIYNGKTIHHCSVSTGSSRDDRLKDINFDTSCVYSPLLFEQNISDFSNEACEGHAML